MSDDKDIVCGEIEIQEGDLELSEAKVRVNVWIDGDVVQELRERAKRENINYQTLMNSLLRKVLFKESIV